MQIRNFPDLNLPLNHPVNLAYEAATATINDINMIDPYHLELGMRQSITNRERGVFPILRSFFERIYGTVSINRHRYGHQYGRLSALSTTKCRKAAKQNHPPVLFDQTGHQKRQHDGRSD